MTIIAELFKTDRVKQATDVYINFDGASDNICYHVFYGLAWLLYSARKAGRPLKRIHILRFKVCILYIDTHSHAHITVCPLCLLQVGHTHNQLDGSFGVLSRHVYGRQCGGTTARDILSFSAFEKVCREVFEDRLVGVPRIRGVYDFKTFLKGVRPRTADRDIQTQFGLQFQASEDGTKIMVRSKSSCSLQVPWGPWNQMLPNPRRPDAIPNPDTVPPVCGPAAWPEFREKIVPTLEKFYAETYRHPVHIPVQDKEEMLVFLANGPAAPTPPEWVGSGHLQPAVAVEDPTDTAPPVPAPAPRARRVWRPFLQPRESRAVQAARAEGAAQTEGDASAETAANQDTNEDATASESYQVGTWVAFEFGDDTFAGTITKVHEGEDLYHVQFTDGDEADYDSDEIHYAMQLYERDFNS